jgi:hypothetical protein
VEAWNWVLKDQYLHEQCHCIDDVFHIFTDQIGPNYCWAHIPVLDGFVRQTTSQFQTIAKWKAEKYNVSMMELLGIFMFKLRHVVHVLFP